MILQDNDGDRKLSDVANELQMELVELCHCQYDAKSIKEESFVCFPSSEEYVTFRAQLGSTADADSTTLLSLIEGWVSTGPTIRVSGVLRRVDKNCPVAISDFSEGECVMPPVETPAPTVTDDVTTASPASSQSDNTAAIVGGIVAIAVVLIIAATTVLVVALVMKYRRGNFSIKEIEE